MGRRYYCEFCDRSFIDDIDSRKNHLKGASHERLKKIYYSKVRDLKTLLEEEKMKEPCKRFRRTGCCPFNEACTFTHYSSWELANIQAQVEEEERKKNELPVLPSLEQCFNSRSLMSIDNKESAVLIDPRTQPNSNPLHNYDYNMLPQSLHAPSFQQIQTVQFSQWG